MLPHTPGLGISETYGSTTIGNIDFSNDSLSLNFTKEYSDIPRRLAILNSSHRKIWSLEYVTKTDDEKLRSKTNKSDPLDQKLIKDNSSWINGKKDNKLNNDNTQSFYNPCISQTCKLFKLGTKVYSVITSGINDSILIFGQLDPKWNGWKLLKNEKKTLSEETNDIIYQDTQKRHDDEQNNKFDNLHIKSPKFIWVRSLTLKSKILGISAHTINTNTSLILVRTTDTIYILRVSIINSSFLLNKVFQYKQGPTYASFAHSSLLITSKTLRLCIIDCVGKFIVFKADNLKNIVFEKINLKFESFYDPTELSNFKKSIWLSPNRLILLSRTQLFEYSFDLSSDDEIISEIFKCRVLGGIWTKFLDIVKSPNENEIYYILTTKEIIIVDVSISFKRKLAWKHYLNDIDTSLYLQLIQAPKSDSNNICVVSSKNTHINYTIEFDIKNFKIFNNPYIFFTDINFSPISTNIYQFDSMPYLNIMIQKQKNSEITFDLLTYTSRFNDCNKFEKSHKPDDIFETLFMKHSFVVPIDKNESFKLFNYLIDYYQFDDDDSPDANEVTSEIYQMLKIFLDDESITHKSLFQMISHIHIPRNIKNIFKIVKHLIKNKDHAEYSVNLNQTIWMTDNMNVTGIYSNEDNIDETGTKIVKFFESLVGNSDKYITTDVTLYLLLSLIELRKNKKTLNQPEITKQLALSRELLPTDYADILDSFEEDANVIGIMDSDDEKDPSLSNSYASNVYSVPTVMSSQVPTIGLSQSHKTSQTILPNRVSPIKKKMVISTNNKSYDGGLSGLSDNPSSQPNSQQYSQFSQSQKGQNYSSQPGFTQSQSKGPKKKKRKTGFL